MEKYNPQFFKKLINEGHSEAEAARIAGTEMDGVALNKNGTVHGRQTNCNVLFYKEDLQPSQGALEGEKFCTEQVAQWLAENGFESLEHYYNSLNLQ